MNKLAKIIIVISSLTTLVFSSFVIPKSKQSLKTLNHFSSNLNTISSPAPSITSSPATPVSYSNQENEFIQKMILAIDLMGLKDNSLLSNLYKDVMNDQNIPYADVLSKNKNKIVPDLAAELIKKNKDPKNLSGFDLELHSSNWAGLNLNSLDLFSALTNIKSLSIAVDPNAVSSFDLSSIKNLSWILSLPKLENFELSFETPLSASENIDFSQFNFLEKNKTIKVLNLVNSLNSLGNTTIKGVFNNLLWYKNQISNFEIHLPINQYVPVSSNSGFSKSSNYGFMIIKKTTASLLKDPSIRNHDPIFIDGVKIPAYVYNGKWYWALIDPSILSNVKYSDGNGKYFTKPQPNNTSVVKQDQRLSTDNYPDTMKKSELEKIIPPFPVYDTTFSIKNVENVLNTKFYIDDQEYGYIIDDTTPNKARLNFDVNNIKYAIVDPTTHSTRYFTSVSHVLPKDMGKISTVLVPSSALSYKIPKKNLVYVDSPKDIKDFLFLDNKKVLAKVFQGKFSWDFENANFDYKKIQYYSKTEKILLSNISFIGKTKKKLKKLPVDLSYIHVSSLASQPIISSLKDTGILSDLNKNKIGEIIKLDNNVVNQVVRSGNIYWDCDIEKIKFKAEDNGDIYYYTDYSLVSQQHVPLVSSVLIADKRTIPPKRSIIKASITNLRGVITLDGVVKSISIRDGKAYWDLSSNELSKIHYVRGANAYFSIISKISSLNQDHNVSEVNNNAKNILPPKTPVNFAKWTSPQQDNVDILKSGVVIGFDEYMPIYENSKIYWVKKQKFEEGKIEFGTMPPKYILHFDKKNSRIFFTDIKNIPYENRKNVSEIVKWDTAYSPSTKINLEQILDPKKEGDILTVLVDAKGKNGSNTGNTIYVKTTTLDNKIIWDNPKVVKNIKYSTTYKGKKVYLQTLNNENFPLIDSKAINTVMPAKITDKEKDVKISQEIVITHNDKSIIIISSIITGGIAPILLSVAFILKRKWGKK